MESMKNLLLVEDQALIAMLTKDQLEKRGYRVQCVANGEDCVKAVLDPDSFFDLILMDIDLGPGMDGTQAAEIVLKEKDIPILFLSSHTEPEIVEKTENITSYGYVVKDSGIVVLDASIKMAFKLFYSKMKEKEIEDTLRKSEARLKGIIDTMQDAFFQADTEGKFIFVNQKAVEMYKYGSIEEMIGMKAVRLYADEADRLELLERLKLSEIITDWECRARRKDDSTFWVSMNVQVLRDHEGKYVGTQGVARDITERMIVKKELQEYQKNLEALIEERTLQLKKEILEKQTLSAELLQSEMKYKDIVENSTSIVLEWDVDGTILFLNKFGLDFFGYSEEEILGKNVVGTIVDPVDGRTGEDLVQKMTKVEKDPDTYYSSENENVKKNGERVWIAWTNKGLRDSRGNLIKTLSIGIDRTGKQPGRRYL